MKRTFDLVLALLLGLLALPVVLAGMLAIWLDTGRPLFFTQQRAGRHGRPFRIYKLRSLHTGDHDPVHPGLHVTRVGSWLRRYAIDEIPQLWNVLRGEMSIVGPRPILLPEARAYDERQRQRLDVRPGLTGWAQIHGRNALSWDERIEHDLWYVHHRSLRVDVLIVLRTPLVLFHGTGVYGPGNHDPTADDVRHATSAAEPPTASTVSPSGL